MYDYYGGYGGMYPGSMLVQTYPGGPLVAAVPVQLPLWNGATAATSPGAGGGPNAGEMGFYYALGYPATGDMTGQPDVGSGNSRRNSVESYQVCGIATRCLKKNSQSSWTFSFLFYRRAVRRR